MPEPDNQTCPNCRGNQNHKPYAEAGAFVGDAEENIIDCRLSFDDYVRSVATGIPQELNDNWRWNIAARLAAA